MKIVVVLGHPNSDSFNGAIARTAVQTLRAAGHEVAFHDLYRDGFDPILTMEEIAAAEVADPQVKTYCHDVANADGLVIVHPNWWGQPPAMVKGWLDRVLRYGVAYVFEKKNGEEIAVGLLKAGKVLVFNTCMTSEDADESHYGDPLGNLWKNCVASFCGIKEFHRRNYRMVQAVPEEQRTAWLDDVDKLVGELFPAG
jgi:NAD(P)H dehydrogenase (quinone)